MQKPLDILFLGAKSGNSQHRIRAMERLGHHVFAIDPQGFVPTGTLVRKFHYETGGLFAEKEVMRKVLAQIPNQSFDAVWVDSGRYVGPRLVKDLQSRFGKVLNYNTDDPLGSRDRYSWSLYKRAVPAYDLVVYNRPENRAEALALGAKKVMVEFRTADEIAHAPRVLSPEEIARWTNDVVFVGTGMEDRGAFMMKLVSLKVPLAIYGPSWHKQKEWPQLQSIWRGPETQGPEEYSASILGAKVCLGLLSKGNRDLHTRRSFEVPAMGGLLCAERTAEHLQLYEDGEEAVFWSSVEECAEVSLRVIGDEAYRLRVARQGHERCLRNGHYNQPFCEKVLDTLLEP